MAAAILGRPPEPWRCGGRERCGEWPTYIIVSRITEIENPEHAFSPTDSRKLNVVCMTDLVGARRVRARYCAAVRMLVTAVDCAHSVRPIEEARQNGVTCTVWEDSSHPVKILHTVCKSAFRGCWCSRVCMFYGSRRTHTTRQEWRVVYSPCFMDSYQRLRERARQLFDDNPMIACPFFAEPIVLNGEGLHHLRSRLTGSVASQSRCSNFDCCHSRSRSFGSRVPCRNIGGYGKRLGNLALTACGPQRRSSTRDWLRSSGRGRTRYA
jgi:hypothetical protein